MRKTKRFLIVAAGLGLAVASETAAQVRVRERTPAVIVQQQARRGWLGFSYAPGERIVIEEIVDGSPAKAAGLLAGDELVAINDIRVSEELIGSLGYSLQPGDQVTVRVRREGRERTFTLRAAERPAQYAMEPRGWVFDTDSLRDRMRIYFDSFKVSLDTMRLPRIRVERTPEGVWMYTDSGRVRLSPDSTWTRGLGGVYVWPGESGRGMFGYFPRDSMRIRFDSAFARVVPDMGAFRFRTDSLRVLMDSMRWIGPDRETVWLSTPGTGITVMGSRAIAGAELTELNPGLAEYFGADEGVLVVRVPAGTPAARAGLAAGDVIVSVNGRAVDDVSSIRRQISRIGTGEAVRLEVVRKNQRRTIELKQD